MRNPFTPSFGSVPAVMAGRDSVVGDIVEAIENGPGDPNLSTLVIGARGTGKTAFLGRLSEEAAQHGWVAADVTAIPGMLDDIYIRAKKAAANLIDEPSKTQIKSIGIASIGSVEIERMPAPETNFRSRMEDVIEALEESGSGLLITVDEVRADLDEMIELVSVYQHFVREGRKVALVMAGLPGKVSNLLSNESASFLRRARRHQFGRVSDADISFAINETVREGGRSIDACALESATASVEGFPYMMQLIGYEMWRHRPDSETIDRDDVEYAAKLATDEMRKQILSDTYRKLSRKDIEFVSAMAEDQDESNLADVAARMGVKSNYASQYKSRLIEAGVIEEGPGRSLAFAIPGFRDFVRSRK